MPQLPLPCCAAATKAQAVQSFVLVTVLLPRIEGRGVAAGARGGNPPQAELVDGLLAAGDGAASVWRQLRRGAGDHQAVQLVEAVMGCGVLRLKTVRSRQRVRNVMRTGCGGR